MLKCIVVTPEKTVLESEADFVALPLFDGEIGIAPGHSPMIGRLGDGEMRLRAAGRASRYYVEGGFVEVVNDVVSVLTNRAVPAAGVDLPAAEEQLGRALQRPAHSEELLAIRERAISQARAQIRVARRSAEGKPPA
jgi:F-type H+-transporting ATPase subunit epsilon